MPAKRTPPPPPLHDAEPRRKAAGRIQEEFRFAMGKCAIGPVLVAASEMGLVAILTGGDKENLIERLQIRFPKALLTEGGRKITFALTRVIAFIEKPEGVFELPLDIRGTPFQRKVWRAVCKIPAGETSTYTAIAQAVGAPRAMRAVGSTCTNNLFSIIVPCHRVLRKSNTPLGGFPKGSKRQRMLITREKTEA